MIFSRHKRRLFCLLSDTHAGKRVGLMHPEVKLVRSCDNGGSVKIWTPEMTTTQEWLWSVYSECAQELQDFAGKDEIIVGHLGDVTNGDKHGGNIPDTTLEDQRIIACANLQVLLDIKNVTKMRIMRGTEAHVPDSAEARVAHWLSVKTGKDVDCANHSRYIIDQEIIDAAHHGPYPGSRDWLKGNVALYHLRDRIYRDRRSGITPATVYGRGHYHQFVHVTLNEVWHEKYHPHHLIITPSFSGLDDYVRKVAKSPPILESGFVVLEFIDDYLTSIHPIIRSIDLRTEEVL